MIPFPFPLCSRTLEQPQVLSPSIPSNLFFQGGQRWIYFLQTFPGCGGGHSLDSSPGWDAGNEQHPKDSWCLGTTLGSAGAEDEDGWEFWGF